MTNHIVNGAGHQILTKLAAGPCYVDAFQALMPIKTMNRTLRVLSEDRLIDLGRFGYSITEAGEQKLAELNRGRAA